MLRNLLKKREEGFTLVELIIVLAIVGLIFVIIFLAVAAAQRGQRDNARRDAVNRTVAAENELAGNNGGIFKPGTNAANFASLQAAVTLPTLSTGGLTMAQNTVGSTTSVGTTDTQACIVTEVGGSYCKTF